MNFLRAFIPGNSNRLKTNTASMDFSYITNKIAAMSYPGSTLLESLVHNSKDDIAQYLNQKHKDNFMIFNISGKPYDSAIFNYRVLEYNSWPDHHPPYFHEMFALFDQALQFLKKKDENLIIVHCLAGKGRTGTVICGLLLYTFMTRDALESIDYYSIKRFKKLNKGVQQPGQVRYVKYVERVMFDNKFVLMPKLYEIINISIGGVLAEDGKNIKLSHKIECIYFGEKNNFIGRNGYPVVCGDFTINCYKNGKKLAYLCLHTSFLDVTNQNRKIYGIKDLDPRELAQESDYSGIFVDVAFGEYHINNNSNINNNNNTQNNTFNNNNNFSNNINNNNNNYGYNINNLSGVNNGKGQINQYDSRNNNIHNNDVFNNNNNVYNNNYNNYNNYNNFNNDYKNYNNNNFNNANNININNINGNNIELCNKGCYESDQISNMFYQETQRISQLNNKINYVKQKNPGEYFNENLPIIFGDGKENDIKMVVFEARNATK